MTKKATEFENERDGYAELLAALGRSFDDDVRIAIHEAGHVVATRLHGHAIAGATVDPGPGFEGRVWGERHMEARAQGHGDASDVRAVLLPLMPSAGEDNDPAADIVGHVRTQCIQFLAGRAAERMILDGKPALPVDDLRQARELAMLICSSEEAIETFIGHCDVAARDLLLPYGDVVIALSTLLRIKRTLDGAEIDALISDLEARKALAVEHRRRADWRQHELSAGGFEAENGHTG